MNVGLVDTDQIHKYRPSNINDKRNIAYLRNTFINTWILLVCWLEVILNFFLILNYPKTLSHSHWSFVLQVVKRSKGQEVDLLKDLWDEQAGDWGKKMDKIIWKCPGLEKIEKRKKKLVMRRLNSRIFGTQSHTQRSIQLFIYTVIHIPITYMQA